MLFIAAHILRGADEFQSERIAHMHHLDLKYHDGIHQTDRVNRDEDARRLRLRVLSLRDENASLKDMLLRKDARVILATKQGDKVRAELDDAKETIRSQDVRLKKHAAEMSNLKVCFLRRTNRMARHELTSSKAEVESLNSSMQDSGKALQEKFALTRELARLRPEMEHLQSQLANHQAVVAEKHDLRRQLDSLEVEFDNERRSKQKARGREDSQAIDELKARLEAAEKRIAAEKKEREKANKEHDKELSDANDRCERLEERATALKTKLKGAQNEVKTAQAELGRCRAELEGASTSRGPTQRPKKTVTMDIEPSRKRRTEEMSFEEINIQTPGNDDEIDRRPTKRRGTEKAGVGEKSNFSITPFLNRTKSLSDEPAEDLSPMTAIETQRESQPESIPTEEDQPEEHEPILDAPEAQPPLAETQAVQEPQKRKPRGRPRTKALGEVSASKKNISAVPAEDPTVQSAEAETSVEERAEGASVEDQENIPAPSPRKRQTLPAKALESRRETASARPSDGEVRKRKRKLLGGANQTLLDDDDAEAVPRPTSKAGPAQTRRVKASLGGGVANAFAGGSSFSPLKRDRRGVHASFLA